MSAVLVAHPGEQPPAPTPSLRGACGPRRPPRGGGSRTWSSLFKVRWCAAALSGQLSGRCSRAAPRRGGGPLASGRACRSSRARTAARPARPSRSNPRRFSHRPAAARAPPARPTVWLCSAAAAQPPAQPQHAAQAQGWVFRGQRGPWLAALRAPAASPRRAASPAAARPARPASLCVLLGGPSWTAFRGD